MGWREATQQQIDRALEALSQQNPGGGPARPTPFQEQAAGRAMGNYHAGAPGSEGYTRSTNPLFDPVTTLPGDMGPVLGGEQAYNGSPMRKLRGAADVAYRASMRNARRGAGGGR
jgi:hypothetical protein